MPALAAVGTDPTQQTSGASSQPLSYLEAQKQLQMAFIQRMQVQQQAAGTQQQQQLLMQSPQNQQQLQQLQQYQRARQGQQQQQQQQEQAPQQHPHVSQQPSSLMQHWAPTPAAYHMPTPTSTSPTATHGLIPTPGR